MSDKLTDKLTDIRAKKISQMPDLDISDWENLYFLLGYKDGDNVANYKINMLQLAQSLVETGLISTGGGVHYISYSGLVHITTPSRNDFEGRIFTINLVPDLGYRLPDSVTVEGATIINYSPETGVLKIDTGIQERLITVSAVGEYVDYYLNINLLGCTYTNNNVQDVYHINDEILLTLTTIDQDHYDVPDISELTLQGLSVINYDKSQGYTGTLRLRFNGENNGNITGSAKRIYLYYFGYSILGDNILQYNEEDLPSAPGNRFYTLTKGRGLCPINFVQGFDYGDGIEYVPEEDASNQNIYIIVPKEYYIENGNIFKDDNNIGYQMTAGTSSFERQVQYTEEANPQKMIYEINYEDVEYYVLCISTEGIQGHQPFKQIGDISALLVNVQWNSELPVKIAAGTTTSIPKGTITCTYGDGHTEDLESGFTILYNDDIGVYNNNSYVAPAIAEMENDIETLTFTCTYRGLSDSKTIMLYIPGDDDNLASIRYNEVIPAIEYNKTYILYKNKVIGINEDSSEYVITNPERIEFNCEYGNIVDNGDGTLTYTAPFRQIDVREKLTIIYKNNYSTDVRFTVKSPDFHDIYWATQLPYSIYDTETISMDMTLFKIMDSNNSYQKVTTDLDEIIVTSTLGLVDSDFIYHPAEVPSQQFVDITVKYKHCQETKRIYVKHGQNPATSNNFYWYCGQYCPSSLTNPENDLADVNVNPNAPGWRKFDYAKSYYRSPHSVFNGTIQFYKDYLSPVEYYVAIPEDLYLFDNNNTQLITSDDIYGTVIISGNTYNIFKLGPNSTMSNKIYYTNPPSIYWYIGETEPVDPNSSDGLITPVLTGNSMGTWYELGLGWHVIPTDSYNAIHGTNNHLWTTFNGYSANNTYSVSITSGSYYFVVPHGTYFKDATGTTFYFNEKRIGTTEIDGMSYDVYRDTGDEFNLFIYL